MPTTRFVLGPALALGVSLVASSPAHADVIHLKNGNVIEVTKYEDLGDAIEIFRYGGAVRIPKSDILKIEGPQRETPPLPAGPASSPGPPPPAPRPPAETPARDTEFEAANRLHIEAFRLYEAGKYREAEAGFERAVAAMEKARGARSPEVGDVLFNMALAVEQQGRRTEAERLYRWVLAAWERAYGPKHPEVARALDALGGTLARLGRAREAEPFLRRARAILEEQPSGSQDLQLGVTLANLARTLEMLGRAGQAEPLYRQSVAVLEKAMGPEHVVLAKTLEDYAEVLRKIKRGAEAARVAARAKAIRAKLGQ